MKDNVLKLIGVWAACLAMAACGGGNGSGDGAGDGDGGAHTDAGDHADHDHGGSGDHGDHGDDADAGSASATQETPEGAITLFIAEMRDADFEGAQSYVDPSCELHQELGGLSESLVNAQNAGESAVKMIKMMFGGSYTGATGSVSSTDGNRAEAVMHFVSKGERPFSLNQLDGKWYIVAGKELVPTTQGGGG